MTPREIAEQRILLRAEERSEEGRQGSGGRVGYK